MIVFNYDENSPERFTKLIITNIHTHHSILNDSIEINNTNSPNLQQLIFSLLFLILFIIGLIANLIVIMIYAKYKNLRKNAHFFINLSISDLMVLIVCLPITITDLFSPDRWFFGILYCKMYYAFEFCVTLVSSLTIISITIERYLCLFKTSKNTNFHRKIVLYIIASIWLMSILISIPYIFMAEYITEPVQCQLNMKLKHIVYVLSLNVIFIFLPALVLVGFYILIIIKLERQNKKMQCKNLFEKDAQKDLINKKDNKPKLNEFLIDSGKQSHSEISNNIDAYKTKMRLILKESLKAFLFFSFHLPIKIFIFWSYIYQYIYPISLHETESQYDFKIQLTDFLSNIATLIYYLHCISNPIIYNFSSIKFISTLFK